MAKEKTTRLNLTKVQADNVDRRVAAKLAERDNERLARDSINLHMDETKAKLRLLLRAEREAVLDMLSDVLAMDDLDGLQARLP